MTHFARRSGLTVVLSTAIVLYGLPLLPANASHGTPEAIATARGTATLAVALDALADHPAFATKLPLTDRSPADVLGFPTLFTRTLGAPLASFDGNYTDLASTIAGASGTGITYTVPGGITVTGDVATFTIHVVAHGEQNVPISYVRPGGSPDDANPRPAISVHGTDTAGTGTVPVGMTLTADLPLRMDKSVLADDGTTIDTANALTLNPAGMTLTLATDSDSSQTGLSFTSRYGFTDVTVAGSASFALSGATTFSDPDASGAVTMQEWVNTLLPDWASFALLDPEGTTKSVDVSLTFDSTLLGSADGGTVSYSDAGAPTYVDLRPLNPLATAPSTPTVALDNLEPFTRIGADDALTGLSQFSAAMAAAQARIDLPLPLLDKRVGDAFSPAGQLQGLVERQGSAAIVCGKANTVPPTGAELAGTTWYCQAVTQHEVTNVSWKRSDGTTTNITGATTATTVGPTPTTNITVTNVTGDPDVQVSFDVTAQQPDGTTATSNFTAEPRIRSAQELQAALDDLTGSTITVGYDATAEKLTYGIGISSDPAPITANYDVGDALRPKTGLSGLTSTGDVSLDVGTTQLNGTYGLLLQSDLAALDSDSLNGQVDRYYVQYGSGSEVSVATATVSGTSDTFSGKIGYLGVDASSTSWAMAPVASGDVLKADLALDATHPVKGKDNVTISNAVSLRRLLEITNPVTAAFNLKLDASLNVAANGTLSSLTTGVDQSTVTVAWNPFNATSKPVATPNTAYNTYLKLFDVLPQVEGIATNATKSTVTLTDSAATFLSAFNQTLTAGAKLPAVLMNATTGATCEDVTVTNGTTMTCNISSVINDGNGNPQTITGMTGGRRLSVRTGTASNGAPTYADADGNVVTDETYDDNNWRAGDTWMVVGDQDALRTLLLENLYDVANRLDQNTEPGYITPLPMLGLTPRQLTPQFGAWRDIATEIGARVPVAAQAPAWAPAKAFALNDLVLPLQPGATATLLFKATTAGTSGSTQPTWPTTAGGTVTDGGVTWTAVNPAAVPPATLQELVTALNGAMTGVTSVGGVALSTPSVSVSLATINHTLPSGATLNSKPHAQLSLTWNGADTIDAPVRMDLAPLSGLDLHGVPKDTGAVGAMDVTTASSAKIRFAVPLSPDIPSGDVIVRADTGITSLTASVDDSTVDFTGNVGSIGLRLGTGARLFGQHAPVTGKHTANDVLSGTATNFTLSGTADAGSGTTKLIDNDVDFVAKGVTTSATVTSGANSCTVSAVVSAHELTCALNNSAVWATGSGYSLSQASNAKVLTASGLSSPGFNALLAGDVIRQGSTQSCTVTGSTMKTVTTVDCVISSGTWDATKTFTVERGAVLTDAGRTSSSSDAADALREFTTFLTVGGASTTITNVTESNASCSVGAVTATTVSCTSGTALSSGKTWTKDDVYRLDLGDPTKVLVDPGAGFDGMGLVGRTVFNTTDNGSCSVTSATKDTLVCTTALTNSAKWDAGDYYEVQGPGVAKATLATWSLTGAVDEDPTTYTGASNLAVSASGPLVLGPSCSDTALATSVSGDACAVLATQIVDPNAAHGTATSVASNVVTTTVPASVVTGTAIRNETAAFSCVITATTATTFTCPAPSGKSWATGNAWRVDGGKFLGVLTFTASFASGTSTAGGLGAAFTGAVAGDEPLEFSLLSIAMNMLKGYVEDSLEGTLAAEPFPLIGLDRTAGSHVMDGLQALEDTLASTPVPAFQSGPNSISGFKASIETYLSGVVSTNSSLMKVLSTKNAGNGNTGVTVTLLCKTTPNSSATHTCADGTDTDENIFDVRVQTTVGGDAAASAELQKGCVGCDSTVAKVQFDRFEVGLPGLELDGPSGVEAKVAWSFDVDFGMARDIGPYIGMDKTDTNDKTFEVAANVQLPDTGACTATRPAGAAAGATPETGSANNGFSSTRCFQVTLGLLQGIMFDGSGDPTSATDGTNADRTGLNLKATLDFGAEGSDDTRGRISMDELLSPDVAVPSFAADATGNVDLYFVTGVGTSGTPAGTSLPSLQGTVHVGFNVTGALDLADADGTAFGEIRYANLQMDAGSFINDFMKPIVSELYALTRPFKTIADILMAPIPVLKELAALTGQAIGTLLDILEQAAQKPLALIRSVISVATLVSDLAASAASTLVGLGSWNNGVQEKGGFRVNKKNATKGPCGGKNDQGQKQPKDCTKAYKAGGTAYKQSVKQLESCPANGCTGKELARTMTRGKSVQKFQGMGITFPFLNDSSAVMGLLVGEHATLARFDTGTFGVTASLEYSWGPFMAGPVPVDISIGGTLGLTARFAIGYDTRGIYNVLKQDRDSFDPSALVDGIFIDDLDAAGTDVPEIQLTFVVTIGAAVSVSIFKVGLYGGVGITINFDLVDPDHDGKIYIDELDQFKDNPICLFRVEGLLDFFFGFFVEIDFKFFSKRWNYELFRLKPPIKLFEVECQRFEPDLAVVESGNLRLNIGDVTAPNGQTYAVNRHYKSTRTQEKFVVRQLEPVVSGQSTDVQVEFSGLVQNDTVPAGGKILANAGSNNDVVELASGATEDGAEILFTLGSTIDGGAGDDKITTGGGADTVTGGDNDDKITTGLGDDTVNGNNGNDVIDGGIGDDVLNGDAGDDKVSGNAGSDWVGGGGDTDTLTGGPGLNATQANTAQQRNTALTNAGKALLLDGRDVVVGGGGSDSLKGHFDADYLFGGAFSGTSTPTTDRGRLTDLTGSATTFSFDTACAASSTDGDDQLNGETGNDVLVGDAGADQLAGGPDDDKACGGSGADLVEGDNANSTLNGNDVLRGGDGPDQVIGRGGADVLDGGPGDDLVDAGDGDDDATGGTGADAIDAGNGSDVVLGDTGTIPASAAITTAGTNVQGVVTGDSGTDSASSTTPIVCRPSANVRSDGKLDLDGDGDADSGRFLGRLVTAGVVTVDGGGNFSGTLADRVVTNGLVQGGEASVLGISMVRGSGNGASSDCVIAGAGHDAVLAGPGDDTVLADAGRDWVTGDTGNDYLRGYQDADEIAAGAGVDSVYGDTGDDTVDGGIGNDDVHGGIGNDTAFGGPGDDTVVGEDGDDVLIGGSTTAGTTDGADVIDGGADNDVIAGDNATPSGGGVTLHDLSGGVGSGDVLGGQTGSDYVFGQGGADEINGNEQDDRLVGNSGNDTIHGDAGNDVIAGDNAAIATDLVVTFTDGSAGNDSLWGDQHDDLVYGQGGTDTIHGNDGADRLVGGSGAADHADAGDTVNGNAGNDVIAGDNATIAADRAVTHHSGGAGNDTLHGDANDDVVIGQGGDDTINGNAGTDLILGDNASVSAAQVVTFHDGNAGSDTIAGNEDDDAIFGQGAGDTINGNAGHDRIVGGSGAAGHGDGGDTIHGDDGTDSIAGDNATIPALGSVNPLDLKAAGAATGSEAGGDTINGNAHDDVIYATGADDTVHGNAGNDYVEGGSGADTLYGDDGVDEVMGGSSTADVTDDGDTISGGADADVLTGDNAVFGSVILLDLKESGDSVGPEAGGDTINGDAANDVIYGQGGNDTLHGDAGDDYVEGNAGNDTINGNDGTDRIVGGSGVDDGGANGALRELDTMLDGGDTIHGNGDADVAVGDNARIDANGTVTLYDEDVSGSTAPPADVSGADTMYGDAGTDRLYGQGAGDTMHGGTETDRMEGNTGADTMNGNEHDDVMAGGTTRDGAIEDTGDTMSGGAGVDVMLGDNGVVSGSGATATWTFFDLDPADGPHPNADLSGNDTMNGDAGTDWMFGQSGDDTMNGGTEDDRMQGNPGADTMAGNEHADDVVGGSAVHYVGATLTALPGQMDGDDVVTGNDGADVVVGDNGRIDRTGATDPNTLDAVRTTTLFDVAVAGQPAPPANASGADTVNGDDGRDVVLGGGKDDTLHGDAGDDHVEGNAGADTMTGDAGDDDLVGGGSSLANGLVRFTAPAATVAATVTNLADGGDTIDGGTGEDAVLADNGVVARTLSNLGLWTYHVAPWTGIPRRTVQAPVEDEVAGAYGDDTVTGAAGHDELHGELGSDTVSGDAGDDALLGDLGRYTLSVNGKNNGRNGNVQKVLADKSGFISETVWALDSLQRDALLYDFTLGGDDVLDGGTGNDTIHAGAGNDTASGNAGATDLDADLTNVCATTITLACDRDVIFGGDGDDWMWGGPDKDIAFGGYGSDHLDVVRPGTANPKSKFIGPDLLYGGWQQDALQGDLTSPSPNEMDKLIDATGVYNVYYVCEGAYGGNSVVRSPSPSMITTLQAIAGAVGSTAVTSPSSGGFNEVSMVFTGEFALNSNPAFDDALGHFTCG